jgi:hypothetical protein
VKEKHILLEETEGEDQSRSQSVSGDLLSNIEKFHQKKRNEKRQSAEDYYLWRNVIYGGLLSARMWGKYYEMNLKENQYDFCESR